MWRRVAVIALTAVAVGPAAAAWAAPVGPIPKKISASHVAVSPCGSLNGIAISWTSTANVVTSAVLSSIPAACNGATLSVTFVGTGNTSLGSIAATTITGTSQTFSTITGSPTATSVTGAYVSVVGP